MFLGKINTQELHCWEHYPGATPGKWEYVKGFDSSSFWFYFYNALHNPISNGEKIVDWIFYYGGNLDQIWAFIMKYNRKQIINKS